VIGAELEAARPATGAGFADAVTFSFGDSDSGLYGAARLGLLAGEPARASALGMLFSGRELVAAPAAAVDAGTAGWERFSAGPVSASVIEPLREWRVALDDPEDGFELAFHAVSDPLELGEDTDFARAAGLRGYEQLCTVSGTVRAGGRTRRVEALGQRGHQWGVPDWDRTESARSVSAWLGPGQGVAISAVRPTGADGHDREAISAFVIESADEGVASVAEEIAAPRLSTLYDARGRQLRASAELPSGGEGSYPRRLAGSLVCGTTLELGPLVLDAAFFAWRMEGREGVGRYDVLRRAER